MANLTMKNWRIQDKLPYLNLGSAGESNASIVTITVDTLIEDANYYLDIGDENGSGLPNTQELKAHTSIGTNGETVCTLSMQPLITWLGKEGVKLLQVRCVYEENNEQVVKESNVFHAKVDRNSGFVYKYNITVFEEYLEKIKAIVTKVINTLSLRSLTDVSIHHPQNNQVLTYDDELEKWKNKDIANFVTLKTFGAIGDGIADDTQALIDAIASSEVELHITSGTYKITSPIVINRNLTIKMDVDTRLLYAPSDRTDYFILISGADNTDNVQVNIEGGEIFVDFQAFIGVCFGYARMCHMEGVTISHVRIGLQTKYGDAFGGDIMVDHCDINNGTTSLTDTIGINDMGADNVFTNCAVVNFETGCFTRSGKFTNFHPWLRRDTLWETSTFAKIEYSGSTFIDCVQDSMRYGFVPKNKVANCSVSNYRVTNNFNLISASKLVQYPICIVKNDEIPFYPLLNNITNSISEDGIEVTLYKVVPNILKGDSQQSAQGLYGDMLNKPIDPYRGDWKEITKSDNWYDLSTGIYVVDTTTGSGGSGYIGNKIGTLFVHRSGINTENATALYIFMSYTDLTLYVRQKDGSLGWRPWVKTTPLTQTS